MTDPFELILKARNLPKNMFDEKEKLYLEAIDILERRLFDTAASKNDLWSTRAEYLHFRAGFILRDETFDDCRKRSLDAIRLIYKCMKLSEQYEKTYSPIIKKMLNQHIMFFGCLLPENETHFFVSCPIFLSKTKAAEFGLSIAAIYKKAACSICNLEIMDERCVHEPGEKYGDKTCFVIKEEFQPLHVALTRKPKDPENIIAEMSYTKEEIYSQFSAEERENTIKNNLPTYCTTCKKMNYNTSELSVEKFFEMQRLNMDIEC